MPVFIMITGDVDKMQGSHALHEVEPEILINE
jgi:hypothetical protein